MMLWVFVGLAATLISAVATIAIIAACIVGARADRGQGC